MNCTNTSNFSKVVTNTNCKFKSQIPVKENEFAKHFKQFSTSFHDDSFLDKPSTITKICFQQNDRKPLNNIYVAKTSKGVQPNFRMQPDNGFTAVKLKKTGIKLTEDEIIENGSCTISPDINKTSTKLDTFGRGSGGCNGELRKLRKGATFDTSQLKDRSLTWKCESNTLVKPLHCSLNRSTLKDTVNMYPKRDSSMGSFNKPTPPRMSPSDIAKAKNRLASTASGDKGKFSFPPKNTPNQSSVDEHELNKGVNKRIGQLDKNENLSAPPAGEIDFRGTLQKTNSKFGNEALSENINAEEHQDGDKLLKKPVGKINKSMFENIPPKPSPEKPNISKKPPLQKKPALKNENISQPNVMPKPFLKKDVNTPRSKPEFPCLPKQEYPPPQKKVYPSPPKQEYPPPPKKVYPSPPKQEYPPPPVQFYPKPPDDHNDDGEGDELYDDVAEVVRDCVHTNNIQDNQPDPEEEEDGDAIYDTVENALTEENKKADQFRMFAGIRQEETINDCIEETEELYDDVAEVTAPLQSNQTMSWPPPHAEPPDYPSQAINNSTPASNGVAETEELYEDVMEQPPQPVNAQEPVPLQQDEIYDDIAAPSTQPIQPPIQPVYPFTKKFVSELYLTPTDETDSTPDSQVAPAKPARTFGTIEFHRFAVPHGLDVWLHKIISANKVHLQNKGMTTAFFDDCTNRINSGSGVFTFKHKKDEDTSSIKSTDSKQEKENKKKMKQLERERKKKEEEEKKKKKQMDKDLKGFNLDPIKDYVVLAQLCAQAIGKGSKKDLAFQHGEEISLLQTDHKCPEGKILARNDVTMRVGYISKEEFNLDDMMFPESRGRVPSLIPTYEDECLGTDTSSQPTQQSIAPRPIGAPPLPTPPPPLPQTPRPGTRPVAVAQVPTAIQPTADDIYDSIGDGAAALPPPPPPGEEIYEQI